MSADPPMPEPPPRRHSQRSAVPRAEWLAAILLLTALAGVLAGHALLVRQAVQANLERHNREAAAALAIALSQQAGEGTTPRTLAAAQFDLGHYAAMQLRVADGRMLVDLRQDEPDSRAPGWFRDLLPIDAVPGGARVDAEGQEPSRLLLSLHAAPAHDALWEASLDMLLLLMLLTIVVGGVAAWQLSRWRLAWLSTLAQAHALAQGRHASVREPRQPGLRQLTRSLNAAARRQRKLAGEQAEQVAALQRQAQLDPGTGLLLRPHFVQRLQGLLRGAQATPSGLVLVRVPRLEAINERLGRDAADRVLGAVADVLLTYVERVHGAVAGRLNGSDFGLVLPAAGVAAETAGSVHETLSASPALRAAGVEVFVGAADGLVDAAAGAALAEADAALARAEAGSGLAVGGSAGLAADPAGAGAWRRQIGDALAGGRAALDEQPTLSRDGELLHLACTLKLQLEAGADFQPAPRWLALARRGRLMPQVDLAALELALQAVAADGRPRAVAVSRDSVAHPGFATEVSRRLQAAPAAARQLSLEWADASRPADDRAWAEAAAMWHRHGCRIGVQRCGGEPRRLPHLREIGVDYVKVDAGFVQGISGQGSVRAYAQSLVALIHDLGLPALAEGVATIEDLQALWALGVDGAAGPALAVARSSAVP